jgi:uncharacterized membrane protein
MWDDVSGNMAMKRQETHGPISRSIIFAAIILGVLALAAVYPTLTSGGDKTPTIVKPTVKPAQDDGHIRIPLSEASTQVKKYAYDAGGKTVRYIVVLGSDGQPRTAFDGCDSCGTSKGYRQDGEDVVCNVCGKRFKIDDLGKSNTLGGGCMPMFLHNVVQGEDILIKKSDLDVKSDIF